MSQSITFFKAKLMYNDGTKGRGCKEMVNINFKMWLCTSEVFQNLFNIYIFFKIEDLLRSKEKN